MNPTIQSGGSVSGPSPARARRGTKIFCAMLLSALLLAGVASLAASLIPFSVLLARVRGVSDSGQGSFFSPEFFRAMQTRLRVIGIANLAAVIALLWFRRRMHEWARQVFSDALILARDVRSAASSLPAIDRLALASLTLFAAVLRIPLLSQPMRYDEAITFLQYASRPFYVALSFYNTPNNHLFHTLLVRLAYLALGNHPWALRLPTFLAGLCLVSATYAAARSLYRGNGALLAAALVASSSILIEYSTNARGYCMVCLLFMMLISIAAYALGHRNWAAWLLLAVVSALGFYTIPIMLYPFGGVVVWLLLSIATGDAKQEDAQRHARSDSTRSDLVRNAQGSAVAGLFVACVLTMLLAGELYSPVLAVSGPKAVFANKWVKASPLPIVLHRLPASLASTWRDWNRDLPMWLTVALAAGFVISLMWHRRVSRQRVPLTLVLLLWVGPLVFVQRVIPFERVWLFALPLYFIGAAAGLAIALEPVFARLHLRHAMAPVAVVLALFVGVRVERSGSVYVSSVYLTNESRGMPALAAWLKAQVKPGDSIVAVPPSDGPLRYYLQNEGVPPSYFASHVGAPNRASPGPHRIFVVVNEASGDTLERVCETAGQPMLRESDAKLLVQFESAALYELPF
jgi:4-amino-4-deoxy-L-arabinose transferase-like glycosyltransferase